mgnify:CR=1 FL=1
MKLIIERCKREEYIKAWNFMYKTDKKGFNEPLYDGVNPSLNKTPLKTEIDNFCTVAYDPNANCEEFDWEKAGFKYGLPVGIFSFVVTNSKIIGKQYIVSPKYARKGIGKAILIENEKTLLDKGYDKYYIGCSHCSAGIYKKYFGIQPYDSNEEHDMYKFNVDLKRDNFETLYKEIILDNENICVVDSTNKNEHGEDTVLKEFKAGSFIWAKNDVNNEK